MHVCQRRAMGNPVFTVFAVLILAYCLLETSEVAAADCPVSWTKHGGLCYKQMTEPKSYTNARCECAKHGAIVATLSTPAKTDFINTWVNGTINNYVLGADRLRDDWYVWMDGVPVENRTIIWGVGQPDNFQNEESCLYYMIKHTWGAEDTLDRHYVYDLLCSYLAAYICEKIASDNLKSDRMWKQRSKKASYPDNAISQHTLSSKLLCAAQCMQNCLCYSFSYKALNRSCLLYNAYYRRLSGSPVSDEKSVLYD